MIRGAKENIMISFKSISLALAISTAAFTGAMAAEEHAPTPPRQEWTFGGFFGKYDRAQLQRGFKVYREVCQACHSLNLLRFGNLHDAGGPQFSEAQVKALAAEYQIKDFNDKGEAIERPGRASDRFPKLFVNADAAAAVHGVAPPDLSVIAKARSYSRGFPLFLLDMVPGFAYQEHGVDYIVALLNGYTKKGEDHWNEFFPGHQIAMPKPLSDGQVEYPDNAPKTVQQYSHDVAAFLMWAAEPKLEERKKTGFNALIFLAIFAGLLYFTKKRIWKDAH
ncbi:MAG: cytochrome c1 [Rhizobiales bacterium 62-17]|nr:MAG: cytochrome c1 [Rhizobiales bacterium 62-17]